MYWSGIAGVDEAGRGPLAGPVVAAAVILPDNFPISGLKDSKQLSLKERNFFYALIKCKAIAFAVGMVDSEEIDRLNIYWATYKAMAIAIRGLSVAPERIVVDGNRIVPEIDIPQEAIVKGDTTHPSIMSASVIAKVTRDRWMDKIHQRFPEYGFRSHKGYSTATHLKALKQHGPTPIHRKSFAPVRVLLEVE